MRPRPRGRIAVEPISVEVAANILNVNRPSGGDIPAWAKRFGLKAYPFQKMGRGYIYMLDRTEVQLRARALEHERQNAKPDAVSERGPTKTSLVASSTVVDALNRIAERLDHIEAHVERLMTALGEGERQ